MKVPLRISALILAALLVIAGCIEPEEEVLPDQTLEPATETSPEPTPERSPEPSPGATPTPDWTPAPVPADWKEYRDPDLGFSLRYPPDLVFKDRNWPETPGPDASPIPRHWDPWHIYDFRSPEDITRGFTILIDDNPQGRSLEEYVNDRACQAERRREGALAGQPAIICPGVFQYGEIGLVIMTEYRGRIFRLTGMHSEDDPEFAAVLAAIDLSFGQQ